MSIKILRTKIITIPRGYAGFAYSQITELEFQPPGAKRAIRAWVREGRYASSAEHFMMSSGTRLGHKADGDRVGTEVLELAAPPGWWDVIAGAVGELDTMKRRIRKHAKWTVNTAREWFDGTRTA